MIPSEMRRRPAPRNRLQQARRRRGAEWEAVLVQELNNQPDGWAVLLPKSWTGQPFDITAMMAGQGLAIECKRIARGSLPYSCFTQNEKEHLSRFEDAGGQAFVAVWRDSDGRRAFIPWWRLRSGVLGGLRGSAKLEDYPPILMVTTHPASEKREETAPCR